MELDEIKKHWDKLSSQYAQDLKSTTKSATIKKLEINAIANSIRGVREGDGPLDVLEVGCGNGHNIFGLSKLFPDCKFTGVDYSEGMIANAIQLKADGNFSQTQFFVGNILKLNETSGLKEVFDVVFTDRCIINLNTIELQLQALQGLASKVRPGGHLIILENCVQTYQNQNSCRSAVGLPVRTADPYNLFIDENRFLEFADTKLSLNLLNVRDFASLHDILLYVLLPKINDGKVDYSHPIMEAVTELLLNSDPDTSNSFGSFGQNRLYLFRK